MASKKRQKRFVTQFRRRHGRTSLFRRISHHSPHNVESHPVKGFGRRPIADGGAGTRGRRPKASQGRNRGQDMALLG
jgi:hypothetical protein